MNLPGGEYTPRGLAGIGGEVTMTCWTCRAPDPPVIFICIFLPGVGGVSESDIDKSCVQSLSSGCLLMVLVFSSTQFLLPIHFVLSLLYTLPSWRLFTLAFTLLLFIGRDQFRLIKLRGASLVTRRSPAAPPLGLLSITHMVSGKRASRHYVVGRSRVLLPLAR